MVEWAEKVAFVGRVFVDGKSGCENGVKFVLIAKLHVGNEMLFL